MLILHIKNYALKNGKSGKPIDPIISNSNCANNVQIVDLFESFAGPSWILSILWGSEVRQEKLHLKDPPLVRTIYHIYIYPQSGYIGKNKKDQWTLSVSHQLLLFCKKGHVTSMSSLQCNCFFANFVSTVLQPFPCPGAILSWQDMTIRMVRMAHGSARFPRSAQLQIGECSPQVCVMSPWLPFD